MDLTALAASVATSVLAVVGGLAVARRFRKIGGDEAQDRLNEIRKELDDAMTDKVSLLSADFAGCKLRLIEVEAELKRVRAERIDLKQEIGDLHRELRAMRDRRPSTRARATDA